MGRSGGTYNQTIATFHRLGYKKKILILLLHQNTKPAPRIGVRGLGYTQAFGCSIGTQALLSETCNASNAICFDHDSFYFLPDPRRV